MNHLRQRYTPDELALNIYDEDDIQLMLDEDMIDSFEEGFMRGYMAS
jgi:hypothetical protein